MLLHLQILHKKKSPTQKTTAKKTTVAKVAPAVAIADDAIKFDKSSAEDAIEANDNEILISGNDNKLTITGNVSKILITGKNNDITLTVVNEIIVIGSGNFVSWEKSSIADKNPVVQDKGGYNNIGKRSGNAQKSGNE